MDSLARSEMARNRWQDPEYRERQRQASIASRAARQEGLRAYWRTGGHETYRHPKGARINPRRLPDMTKDEHRLYAKLRRHGAGREESLRAVLGRGA